MGNGRTTKSPRVRADFNGFSEICYVSQTGLTYGSWHSMKMRTGTGAVTTLSPVASLITRRRGFCEWEGAENDPKCYCRYFPAIELPSAA